MLGYRLGRIGQPWRALMAVMEIDLRANATAAKHRVPLSCWLKVGRTAAIRHAECLPALGAALCA